MGLGGCASARSFLALDYDANSSATIRDPFTIVTKSDASQNLVFRTRKGDRAVEVEVPGGATQVSNVSIPVAAAFAEPDAAPGSETGSKTETAAEYESSAAYISGLERLKAYFRAGRYELGVMETDSMLRLYPVAPRLHQMRGTLLERIGHRSLAIKSWRRALELDPGNAPLRQYVEQREQGRSLASP